MDARVCCVQTGISHIHRPYNLHALQSGYITLCMHHGLYTVANLEGGDGLTPLLTVLVICDISTVLWRHQQWHEV